MIFLLPFVSTCRFSGAGNGLLVWQPLGFKCLNEQRQRSVGAAVGINKSSPAPWESFLYEWDTIITFLGWLKSGMLFLESSFHKMAESDAHEFSGDELYGDLPWDFDLAGLTEEERRAFDRTANVHESDSVLHAK